MSKLNIRIRLVNKIPNKINLKELKYPKATIIILIKITLKD